MLKMRLRKFVSWSDFCEVVSDQTLWCICMYDF